MNKSEALEAVRKETDRLVSSGEIAVTLTDDTSDSGDEFTTATHVSVNEAAIVLGKIYGIPLLVVEAVMMKAVRELKGDR